MKIKASRWPWQAGGSHWTRGQRDTWGWSPLPGMGRFGGGWNWCLGVQISKRSILFNLLYGQVKITFKETKP